MVEHAILGEALPVMPDLGFERLNEPRHRGIARLHRVSLHMTWEAKIKPEGKYPRVIRQGLADHVVQCLEALTDHGVHTPHDTQSIVLITMVNMVVLVKIVFHIIQSLLTLLVHQWMSSRELPTHLTSSSISYAPGSQHLAYRYLIPIPK